jgi:hypothetical protein
MIFLALLFLANIPNPAPGDTEKWLWSFAALMLIAERALAFFQRMKGSPQTMQMASEFTTRASFHSHAELNRQHHEKIEARVAALERKLEDDKDEIIAAGEVRASGIHDRINIAIEKIGELRGEVRHLGNQKR